MLHDLNAMTDVLLQVEQRRRINSDQSYAALQKLTNTFLTVCQKPLKCKPQVRLQALPSSMFHAAQGSPALFTLRMYRHVEVPAVPALALYL